MVGVAVGVKDGVESIELFAHGLKTEVGRGVDDYVATVVGEEDGGPGAFVAGVGRFADSAVAGERGNAHGGAGT